MRIVSLAPSVTETLFALGLGSEIVANTAYCDYPDEAKKIPKAGGFSTSRLEKILEFKPDVVITCTVVQNQAKELFSKSNLRHIHLDPRSLMDIYKDILLLGKELKVNTKGINIVNSMKEKAKKLRSSQLRVKPRVYIEEWFDPPMGSGNWVPDIVELAGGVYNLIPKGEISQEILLSKLQKFNPEIIFVAYCGYMDKSDTRKILDRAGWSDIDAVKNRRVFAIDDRLLNRPGPRVLEAAEVMQKFLAFNFG